MQEEYGRIRNIVERRRRKRTKEVREAEKSVYEVVRSREVSGKYRDREKNRKIKKMREKIGGKA